MLTRTEARLQERVDALRPTAIVGRRGSAPRLVVAPRALAGGLAVVLGVAVVAGPTGVLGVAVVAAGLVAVRRRGAPARAAVAVEHALPELLESIARRLRAGASLGQAVASAEVAGSDELATAWQRTVDLVPSVGVGAALDTWAGGGAGGAGGAVRLAASALALAASTGGSPARAIDGVAATLRARAAVADELRALTAQARLSALVIAASPLAFGGLAALSDARTRAFLTSRAGAGVAALGLALDATGAWWMGRLCRMDVT